ncbi:MULTISPECIES: hypothetical protein [unclassified Mesorhizobium]|uniref:hypothetical protein n=1 Tax=unclassified Mesorhizobium TaxID=325217 RepID=UPI00112E9A19|nr:MULTISPECIES: hypothetical protein [unclassified Mesorhizobium]TPK99031.1 hypothetical protein FJ567_17270 [Mesorhizobium sp. B2-4-16]TPL73707.1 hypothetical protein FJ956_08365 [Mesorhizobium sp. B2-4-3]
MLRYTFGVLKTVINPLSWNAHFESFAVHARSLYEFLTDGGDSRNFMAKHFGVAAAKKTDMSGTINRMNEQVMHLTKNRFSENEMKVTLSDAGRVARWIEEKISAFAKALKEPYSNVWNEEAATPPDPGALLVQTTQGPPSASSLPQVVGSNTTSSSSVTYTISTKD